MRLLSSLLLCLLIPACILAQVPVADFTVSATNGCAPLAVNFTDKSSGSPIAWFWDFGNGSLDQRQNPTGISFNAGTYSVTLTVKNANGVASVTKTDLIVANPSPTADFTADKNITCLPASIQFTDLSVANAGTIVKWEWGFDDQQLSSAQNPSHQYASAGYYSISLKVTSSTGCFANAYKGRYIRVLNGVKANFDVAGPSTCAAPFNVTYKNLTSGPGNLTYAWDLGNGNTSSATSPPATYPTGGSYTIKLTAQSDFGCADSVQKTIPVNGIPVTFTAPANICLGSAAAFQSTSSPAPVKVMWDFGDGSTSTQVAPSNTYKTAGTYTVKLYNTFATCTDSATKTVNVYDKPAVSFSSTKSNTCKAPLAVTFTNTSPDAVSSNWTFGDGATGAGHPTASHTYTSAGSNNVTLDITDSKGCKNSVTQATYVNIFAPNVQIGSIPNGVCVGQNFTAAANVGSLDGVATYSWDWGDGSAVSTSANPSHSYAAPGVKTVTLSIVTNDGCTGSATTSIQVGLPPNVDFSADKTDLCNSETVAFTNNSTPATGITAFWDFGDKTSSNIITPAPHKFNDSGFYSIKLVITSNGCADSLIKSNLIHVKPPIANFGYLIQNCNDKKTVTFTDSTKNDPAYGALTYAWAFGDPGNGTAATPTPMFSYPAVGTYNVQLTVSNTQCTDVITKPVKLYDTKPVFTLDKPVYCRKERTTLFSTNDPAYIKSFVWIIDGVPDTTTQLGHFVTFNTSGNHTAQLTTIDINGCAESSPVQNFTVTGPTAKFAIANGGGCANGTVTFNDLSTSPGTLTKWVFNFGDGTPAQTFTAPPFTHKYANEGRYDVLLTVYDNTSASCSDTFSLRGAAGAVVTKPTVNFGVEKNVFCANAPLPFTDSSSAVATYSWSFGDGGTDNVQNPVHTYANTGNDTAYTVKLIVTDSVGCTDSLVRNKYISIRMPKPLYSVKDTVTLCPPLETKFFFKGKDYESYAWDFGDGSPLAAPSPLDTDTTYHFYNGYGNFTAKLYAFGNGGCVDSASIPIRVTNPTSNTTVAFDPKTNCNDLTVNFNITTPFGTAFQFYFGDGTSDTAQKFSFQHFYGLPNVYSPAILLYDSTGCQAFFGGFGSIDIKGAVPIFGKDKGKFCDSGTVYFTDYSQEAHDPIVTKTWDFGDGASAVLTGDAVHKYQNPGLFVPALKVTTAAGCEKTYTDTVRVLATPTPIITSADGVCNNLIIDFKGSLLVPPDTAITWKWDLGNGQTSAQQNVSVNYPDTGKHIITLQAVNSLGCKGDTSKTITVYPLPNISVTGDTTVMAGAGGLTMPLAYSANATTFNWTPEDFLSCTNCPNPFANPKYTTKYNVRVTDDKGCVSNRNITLVVLCNNKNFFIPNTFSPNNDGANDRFYPRGTGLDRIQALRIFNRWGEMVFEKRNFPANDASSGWDGSFRGKAAASDTYVYMIDIICENATIITYKGNITLIR